MLVTAFVFIGRAFDLYTGGIGGTLIDSSAAKAAQYHASLSSLILTGQVSIGQESRSCQKYPAPFEFSAVQHANASASVEVLDGDEPDEHDVDCYVNAFGEEESFCRHL